MTAKPRPFYPMALHLMNNSRADIGQNLRQFISNSKSTAPGMLFTTCSLSTLMCEIFGRMNDWQEWWLYNEYNRTIFKWFCDSTKPFIWIVIISLIMKRFYWNDAVLDTTNETTFYSIMFIWFCHLNIQNMGCIAYSIKSSHENATRLTMSVNWPVIRDLQVFIFQSPPMNKVYSTVSSAMQYNRNFKRANNWSNFLQLGFLVLVMSLWKRFAPEKMA